MAKQQKKKAEIEKRRKILYFSNVYTDLAFMERELAS
jgi:hypothetical protein